MTPSSILDSAREDTSSSFRGSIGLAILCAIVLAFNWKYVYNFAAGPFPFDPVEASFPNRPITREFVRAEGPLLSTGWAQETTVRLLRGLIETKDTSAHFLAMRLDGRLSSSRFRPTSPARQSRAGLCACPQPFRHRSANKPLTRGWWMRRPPIGGTSTCLS